MKGVKKDLENLHKLPRAKTLRTGSYRRFDGHENAVRVSPQYRELGDISRLSNSDWALLLVDAGWEKAQDAYYKGLDEGYAEGLAAGLKEGSAS